MSQLLANKTHRLQAGRLDGKLPVWSFNSDLVASLGFIRVGGMEKFWEDAIDGQIALDERQCQFLVGLHRARLPWAYVVSGQRAEIEVYVGLSGGSHAASHWLAPLQAVFPGCQASLGPLSDEFAQRLSRFPSIASVSGNPGASQSLERGQATQQFAPPRPRLEQVFRAMADSEWVYLVAGSPIHASDIEAYATELALEEQEIVSTYLRAGTAEEHNNPVAGQYVKLLRATRQLHDEARGTGMWDLQAFLFSNSAQGLARGAHVMSAAFSGPGSTPQPFRVTGASRTDMLAETSALSTRLTSREAALLSRFPAEEFPGYRLSRPVRYAPAPPKTDAAGHLAVGVIADGRTQSPSWYEIGLPDLAKHTLLAGVTGSGKTQTCQFLLNQLWLDHRIPWMVLEPSNKAEYRRLLRSHVGPDLKVYTLGDETCSPLRINPLEVLPGVHVQTHIDGVFALFSAAFALVTPMPDVLSLAIHEVYRRFGWDLIRGIHPQGHGLAVQPRLNDLLRTLQDVVKQLGYAGEVTSNIRAGLETRLRNLITGSKGASLNQHSSVPIEDLLSTPSVIELGAIGDDDQKAFVIATLLLRLAEHRRIRGFSAGTLRHVLVVEEAHRLLRAVPESTNAEVANPRGKAVESFCNLLAEVRAYGQGVFIIDQIPGKLAAEAVKSTNLKIVHRLVAEDDRHLVGGAMNLEPDQSRHMATLTTGHTIVYAEGQERACHLRILNHASRHGYADSRVTDDAVRNHMGRDEYQIDYVTDMDYGTDVASESCAACKQCECGFRREAMNELLAKDYREQFTDAVQKGFEGLWSFGLTVARVFCGDIAQLPNAAYCLLIQLATAAEFAPDDVEKLRRNLNRIRMGNEEEFV